MDKLIKGTILVLILVLVLTLSIWGVMSILIGPTPESLGSVIIGPGDTIWGFYEESSQKVSWRTYYNDVLTVNDFESIKSLEVGEIIILPIY